MILTLQVLVSLIFFANKVLVFAGRNKAGWLIGAIGATLAGFYFYLLELWVYTALEFGLIVLMGYGFLKKEHKNPVVESRIRGVTFVIMFALAYFAFSGLITVVELGSSLGLLIGTLLLTTGKTKSGWLLYALAHALAAYLGYYKGQQFFAVFQVASVVVSIAGAMKNSRRASS